MKIEILIYFSTVIISMIILNIEYKHYGFAYNSINDDHIDYQKKIRPYAIVLITLLWLLFNWLITSLHPNMGADWTNYSADFDGYRETPSLGLSLLIKLVHLVHGDMYLLSRISTAILIISVLIAYKYSKIATPQCMLFFFLTQTTFLSIALLKQSSSNAFATIFFVFAIDYKNKASRIICILCIFLACLFHPTGFILIPLYIFYIVPKSNKSYIFYLFSVFVLALFFEPIMVFCGKALSGVIPSLGNKISSYFNENTTNNNSISLSFIKSLGELIIVLVGIYKRKTLRKYIPNYDNYLVTAITGEFFYLISVYSLWLYRMIYLFYFALFVFFDLLLQNMKLKSNYMIIKTVVFLILGGILYRFLYISF